MADLAALVRQPQFVAHSYDPAMDRALIVRMDERDLAAASFLDGRILGPRHPSEWVGGQGLTEAVEEAGLAENLGYIFHLGHVGSTLLSRLLGAHPGVLSLREPAALRTFATAPIDDARLTTFLKLWSRPFRPGQQPIVKATSFCAGMAKALLARPSGPRAVFLTARPEPYLATILGGENNHLDIGANAEARLRRLHAALCAEPFRLGQMLYGEIVAMSWAAEMVALEAAAGPQALWLDFDDLLAGPEAALAAAFAHFGREVTAAAIAAIAAGPDMRRYAKAPEHSYDAALRTAVLDQARRLHGGEIARGLAWLEGAARDHPLIAATLSRTS